MSVLFVVAAGTNTDRLACGAIAFFAVAMMCLRVMLEWGVVQHKPQLAQHAPTQQELQSAHIFAIDTVQLHAGAALATRPICHLPSTSWYR